MIAASFSLFDFLHSARSRTHEEKMMDPDVARNETRGVKELEQKDNVFDWRMSESFFWGLPPCI